MAERLAVVLAPAATGGEAEMTAGRVMARDKTNLRAASLMAVIQAGKHGVSVTMGWRPREMLAPALA